MQVTLDGVKLDFPAVELSLAGRIVSWEAAGNGVFRSGPITLRVRFTRFKYGWRKHVEITGPADSPTPDYLVVDRQRVPDPALRMRGYVATAESMSMFLADEEGGGAMPGCGYPLIGGRFFAGLEHQCGFNTVVRRDPDGAEWELRQHPVWENGRLTAMTAVLGAADDPEAAFRDYVAGFRCHRGDRALFSFCSFWSEPYCGNYEYVIGGDNYRSFVRAFAELGLRPEIYTLDAGWQERASIFQAKAAAGGEAGLVRLRRFLEARGSELSLWVSHNGPMGLDPAYLERLGIATGGGQSSTYRGDRGFGVLLDRQLEERLTARFRELVTPPVGAVHLKMDWDNDCATAPRFREKYPTRNHVREASVNVQNRIALAVRQANPAVVLRHGWWPSPWQLKYSDHLFLADSGDCEYSSIPALNQRDCAFTARDIQYYNHYRRDGGMVPLNALDNHDFPHAPRNPFMGDDGVWCNAALWAVLRGTGYQPWTLQPEALTAGEIAVLREVMELARKHEKELFRGDGAMIGGNPRHGEVYGFRHKLRHGALIALRNPLPLPQKYVLPPEYAAAVQLYPDCRIPGGELVFAPHEVKVLRTGARPPRWNGTPFQREGERYVYPASAVNPPEVAPAVAEVYRIGEFRISDAADQVIPGGMRYWFKLRAPYRMSQCGLFFRLTGPEAARVRVRLYLARDARATGNCRALPLTEIFSGNPGRGEYRNPEPPMQWGRFFHAEAPSGGIGFFRLELTGAECELELWAAGCESSARHKPAHGPAWRGMWRFPAFPPGFPVVAKMEVSGHEAPVEA